MDMVLLSSTVMMSPRGWNRICQSLCRDFDAQCSKALDRLALNSSQYRLGRGVVTLYHDCGYMWLVYRKHYPGGIAFGWSFRFICIFWMWIGTRLLIKWLGLYLPDILKPSKPNIVWLNLILAIPNLWFHLDIYICCWLYAFMFINGYELIRALFVFLFEYNLWLQVQGFICGNLSHWEFISHPLFWVNVSGSGLADPRETRGR